MLRRLHPDQPDSFAFTPANQAWAEAQVLKYPEGRQASAIIPLLWRAQEQEGWLTRPAIEHVAAMLGMAYIRALEVATFYFMFQLQPTGSVAHVQVCGTLSCMLCGAEDLVALCKDRISPKAHALSADGKFSWEEVECLGSCTNAPMAQIGKDYYEDLTVARLGEILDEMAAGRVPTPGPQNGRYAAEPKAGLTTLKDHAAGRDPLNASAALATRIGDTVKRIDGTEVPLVAPWVAGSGRAFAPAAVALAEREPPRPAHAQSPAQSRAQSEAQAKPKDAAGARPAFAGTADKTAAEAGTEAALAKVPAAADPSIGKPEAGSVAPESPAPAESAPDRLEAPLGGKPDDLKRIQGVGPKLEALLNEMGFWHFHQIAAWGPAEIAWVDSRLVFKGRIIRDDWVGQAKAFAAE
jgi:NADH-quinone oxidoreductase subunit E